MNLFPLLVPAGSDTQFQYNNGGIFGGVASATYNDSTGAITFQPAADSTMFFQIKDQAGNVIFNGDSTNERVGIGTAAPTQRLTLGGTGVQSISRDVANSALSFLGGTDSTDSAYFQITGNTNTSAPGLGSAEFVIRNNTGISYDQRSKYALYSFDGATWTPRFVLLGDNGDITITGKLGVGKSVSTALTYGLQIGDGTAATDLALVSSVSGWIYLFEDGVAAANERFAFGYHQPNDNFQILRNPGAGWTDTFSLDRSTGFIGVSESAPETLTEWTHATPYLTLHNDTHEDTDGGRESRIIAKGEQSGGEETALGYMEFAHDGAADDQNGYWDLYTNNGTAATKRIRVDSAGNTKLGDGGTTNYANFAADGELTLTGTARVKKEFEINAVSFAPGASGATHTNVGNYDTWAYTINDNMIVTFEVPHDWDSSTALEIILYWGCNEAYATNTGEVQWQIAWSACPADATESLAAPTHTGTIDYGDQNIPATAQYLTKTSAGTIAAASLAVGDLVGLTVSRVALDGGANPVAEPYIAHLEVHFTSNKLGEAT